MNALNPEFPVYTDIVAEFKKRKEVETASVQLMATCTLNGKPNRTVWIEVPAPLYNGYKGKVRIVDFLIKSGMLEARSVEKI